VEGAVDLIPVLVLTINILELDDNLSIVSTSTVTPTPPSQGFQDGETFQYTATTAATGLTTLPKGIQLTMVGLNQQGETLSNSFLLMFTNSCDERPVVSENQSAGWTIFVSSFHNLLSPA